MVTRLFHYTSINNLALILRSKKIRFNRLDRVNDPTEGSSSDFHNLSSYIFVSCFTENEEENLVLWNMYTPLMRGVRIEFPLPIFNSFNINHLENFLYSENEYLNEEKEFCIIGGKNEPIEIEYSDLSQKLNPSILTNITFNSTEYVGLKISKLGVCKRTIWSVEKEYRFKLEIYPIDPTIKSVHFPDRYKDLIKNKIQPKIDSYYIDLNLECFKNIKIVMSPKNYSEDAEIIDSLVQKFNPSAIINESMLLGLIR